MPSEAISICFPKGLSIILKSGDDDITEFRDDFRKKSPNALATVKEPKLQM
jgi:hypothetical protein